MSYQALYRVWRPQKFADMVGQEVVTRTLKNALITKQTSHAYLFTGPRGTGKTSAAKIFAKAINCLNPIDGSPCLECENCRAIEEETSLDVVEMDAASNRRIDDIRNLRDNVIYPPANLKYKVYIIDEAHMITREAFNALLKIMEEPPKHLVFILATTEIDKIPKTILSRVQKFEFNKIDSSKIKEQINIILKDQNIKMENEAVDLIIRKAKGAMRDALSILDQVLSFNKEEFLLKDVEFILGTVDFEKIDKLVSSILVKDQKASLNNLKSIRDDGKSNLDIVDSLVNYYRDLMILKVSGYDKDFENEERLELLKKKLDKFSLERILTSLDVLNDYFIKINNSSNTDILSEVLVLRLIDTVDMSSLISRVEKLERLGQSDIVDTINGIIDNRLKNYSPNTLITNKNSINEIKKSKNYEVGALSNKNENLEAKSQEKVKENEETIESSEKTILDKKTINEIKNMVVATSGTMLNTLFRDEGFNYVYQDKEFTLIIEDEFYRIFIETKLDEISEKLSQILKKEVNFSLKTGTAKDEKEERNIINENIDKLKNIFGKDLIIK